MGPRNVNDIHIVGSFPCHLYKHSSLTTPWLLCERGIHIRGFPFCTRIKLFTTGWGSSILLISLCNMYCMAPCRLPPMALAPAGWPFPPFVFELNIHCPHHVMWGKFSWQMKLFEYILEHLDGITENLPWRFKS